MPRHRPENEMTADCASEGGLSKTDIARAALLFAAALALRIPFRSQLAYQWDSAQFALAVGEYDIRISQPHAPGFYGYVMLGRLVNWFVGEPHQALVWLSVIAGAWLVAMGYLLATSMFGRWSGWGTGLILLTSPLCWFHSDIALTNIVDSALVVSFVFAGWRAIQRGVTWRQTIAMAVLLAGVGSVRQQSAVLLIPLVAYVFLGFARPRGWKLLCAVVLAAGFSLFWFVPVTRSAGGVASYMELLHLKSRYDAPRTVWGGGGVGALLTDISCMGRACWVGLLIAAIIPLAEFIHGVVFEERTAKDSFYRANKTQLNVLGLWITPMVLFGFFLYVALPGHVLNFFPAIAVLASLGLSSFAERLATSPTVKKAQVHWAVLTIMVAVNAVVFVYSPRSVRRLLLDVRMTGVEIRQHDAESSACFQMIRKNWPSGNVVVCHYLEDFFWGFRQFQYHLPEYQNVLLNADASLPGDLGVKKWVGYQRQTTFQSKISIPDGYEVILVVPPGQSLDFFKSCFDVRKAVLVMESGAKLYKLQP